MAVNEVRQILMNELGLTRESVRAEMRDIVRDCVDRNVATLNIEGIVAQQIKTVMTHGPQWSADAAFATAIKKAVSDYAARLVDEQFTVSVVRK